MELEKLGCSLVTVAFTGVAACNIQGGKTIHSVFYLPVNAVGTRKLQPLSAEQAYVCFEKQGAKHHFCSLMR